MIAFVLFSVITLPLALWSLRTVEKAQLAKLREAEWMRANRYDLERALADLERHLAETKDRDWRNQPGGAE